jgi:TonB family protein
MHRILTALAALPLVVVAQTSPNSSELRLRAIAAGDAGNYAEAQQLLERALAERRATFGESSAPYAAALVDLARAYQATAKRSAEAVALYRQALPIQEATLGREHPDVAATLYYLALDAHGHNRAEEALAMYRRALEIRAKAFGASDPRLAEILTPLASLQNDESLYQRSLAILEASTKASSLRATTLEMYAGYLRLHDRASEAETVQSQAKDIRIEHVAEVGARRGAAAASANPFRVNAADGVKPPSLKFKVEPEYSDMARLAKLQGTVVLKIVVGTDGLAHDIQLLRGVGLGLDEKAAEAIVKWIFNPGSRNGQPVPVMATVEVNFKLL